MALLDELRGDVGECDLVGGGHVVEVGVLHQGVQAVVVDRPVGVAQHRLGEAAVVEGAERAVAVRVVELAEQSPGRVHLVLEAVPEQPGGALGATEVRLFGVVEAVLDAGGELQCRGAEADLDGAGEALGLGAGLLVLQGADVGVEAEVPLLGGREADAGGVRQPGHGGAVLVAFLEEHAGGVRDA